MPRAVVCLRGNGVKEFLKAPWAGQKVEGSYRIMAAVFSILGLICAGYLTFHLAFEGAESPYFFHAVVMVILIAYVSLLFAFSAIRAKAPLSWLPWE